MCGKPGIIKIQNLLRSLYYIVFVFCGILGHSRGILWYSSSILGYSGVFLGKCMDPEQTVEIYCLIFELLKVVFH